MQVLITGGKGLLGSRLCREIISKRSMLAADGVISPVEKIILWDRAVDAGGGGLGSCRSKDGVSVQEVHGDICSDVSVSTLFDQSISDQMPLSVFHLASMMSGEGEEKADECFEVNVNGTRRLLGACRRRAAPTKFLFASSIAAAGPTPLLSRATRPRPESTYGTTKAMAELLVVDHGRRAAWGVDGRVARVPTVAVRPGPPNAASTAAFSNVVKALAQGQDFSSPLPLDLKHPLISYKNAISCFIQLHDLEEQSLHQDRVVNFPALVTSIADIAEVTLELLHNGLHNYNNTTDNKYGIIDGSSVLGQQKQENHLPTPKVTEHIDVQFTQLVLSMATAVEESHTFVVGGLYEDRKKEKGQSDQQNTGDKNNMFAGNNSKEELKELICEYLKEARGGV